MSAASKLLEITGSSSEPTTANMLPRDSNSPATWNQRAISAPSLLPTPDVTNTARSDPDSWLVARLATLPPGCELHEAWRRGPAALFAFLNALWVTAERPDPCIRLDCGSARLKVLADLCNDDVPVGA